MVHPGTCSAAKKFTSEGELHESESEVTFDAVVNLTCRRLENASKKRFSKEIR
jgi:hypothetical protein